MRRPALWLFVVAGCAARPDVRAMLPDDRIPWRTNLDEAARESRRCGKPLLVFQLLGRLDGGC